MRRALTSLLVVVALLVAAAPAGADQPAEGTMTLSWNSCFAGPGMATPDWVGSIAFDGEVYGMAFFNLGTGKPFDTEIKGSALFFTEIYALYPAPIGDCPGGAVDLGNALLWGFDSGMVNLSNSFYHMSGSVEEAYGVLGGLAGGSVYMSGVIVWDDAGAPVAAPGVARFTRPNRGVASARSPQHQAL